VALIVFDKYLMSDQVLINSDSLLGMLNLARLVLRFPKMSTPEPQSCDAQQFMPCHEQVGEYRLHFTSFH
jgi:hypothetical protein